MNNNIKIKEVNIAKKNSNVYLKFFSLFLFILFCAEIALAEKWTFNMIVVAPDGSRDFHYQPLSTKQECEKARSEQISEVLKRGWPIASSQGEHGVWFSPCFCMDCADAKQPSSPSNSSSEPKKVEKNAQAGMAHRELMPTPIPPPLTPVVKWSPEPRSGRMLDTTSSLFSGARGYIQNVNKATEKTFEGTKQEILTDTIPAFIISQASAYGAYPARIVKNVPKVYEYVGQRLNEAIDIVTTGDMSIEEAEQWGEETVRKSISILFNIGGPADGVRPIFNTLKNGSIQEGLKETVGEIAIGSIGKGKPWLTVPAKVIWRRVKELKEERN